MFADIGNGILRMMGIEVSQRHMSAEGSESSDGHRKPWLLRWLNDETEEQRVIDLKEKEEREDILRRVRNIMRERECLCV